MKRSIRCSLFLLLLFAAARAQQVPDPNFKPPIASPAYAEGKGPVVLLDEAHYNFHTASGRYQSFAELLRRDGYVVNPSKKKFQAKSLREGRILVIANALSKRNEKDWNPPIEPSFTPEEIKAVREWVEAGGALMLIIDHFPMPGTAGALAEAFGARFHNGYAIIPPNRGPIVFKRSEQELLDHPITQGRSEQERVHSIATFGGSAFTLENGEPLFRFRSPNAISYTPEVFGKPMTPETPRIPVTGWLQGAVLRVGKGRVALFGEAAMFSAQLAGPNKSPMGMNAPVAAENPQFLLNVIHWLSGLLEK